MDSTLLNPRTAYRWGLRVAAVSAPAAVLLLFSWGFRLYEPLGARPTLVLMLFMLFLLLSVVGGAVATIAATQLAVHKAFTHGYTTGAQHAAVQVGEARARHRLSVVRDDSNGTT